jgi:hypothetical protein
VEAGVDGGIGIGTSGAYRPVFFRAAVPFPPLPSTVDRMRQAIASVDSY